eukprot:2807594-Rhodomonas_salina.1
MRLVEEGAGTAAAAWLTGRGRTTVGQGVGSACPGETLSSQNLVLTVMIWSATGMLKLGLSSP